MTHPDLLRTAERRAVVRSVAAVLGLLLLVSVGSVWVTDTADEPARDVLGLGYGFRLAARDAPDGGSGALAGGLFFSIPVLLVLGAAVVAALVAADPGRRRLQVLAGLGSASTVVLLLVVLGVGADDDLAGGGTGLALALVCSAAAGLLGVRGAARDLTRAG